MGRAPAGALATARATAQCDLTVVHNNIIIEIKQYIEAREKRAVRLVRDKEPISFELKKNEFMPGKEDRDL